jgi:GNAT superfamily N-acetyltransferase
VAEDNGEVVGFIAGVVNLDEFYKEFLQKNIFKAGLILFFNSFKPAVIRKIFEALFYATAKTSSLPKAELLSIAITDNYRGKGVGQGLFERLAGELRNRGVKEFKCLVGSNLLPACKFYEKTGGVFHSETEVHKGEKSRIYLWRI